MTPTHHYMRCNAFLPRRHLNVWVAQFLLTSLVVMDAFGHAVAVGWLIHEEKTAAALATGFAAWMRAVARVKPDFQPSSFFSDDDPAEHKAIGCGPLKSHASGSQMLLYELRSDDIASWLCRLAFGEEVPVYLCTWHLLKAIGQRLKQLVRARVLSCCIRTQQLHAASPACDCTVVVHARRHCAGQQLTAVTGCRCAMPR